jgi:hypothetical protein
MFKGSWGFVFWGAVAAYMPAVAGAQVLPPDYGSCWGNCGERDVHTGCACDSWCEARGDCCPDKNDLCYGQLAVPLCPLIDFDTTPYVWGTDLGWTYEHRGKLEFLFGDTATPFTHPFCTDQAQWPNDDALAYFTTTTRPAQLPTSNTTAAVTCPAPSIVLEGSGRSMAPVEVSFPNPLHPYHTSGMALDGFKTPGAGWSTGTTAFTWFTTHFPLPCGPNGSCPGGSVCGLDFCYDPTAPVWEDPWVRSVEIAFRPNESEPSRYRSGHTYFTNKFSLLTPVTVNRFDPSSPATNDYQRGNGALLVFGRSAFLDPQSVGRTPVYLAYQPVAELAPQSDNTVAWLPRYYSGLDTSGNPTWSFSLDEAQSVIPSDFNYVGFTDAAYIVALKKWVMLYGGDIDDPSDERGPFADDSQPRKGAIHVRIADHPWGPWTEPAPLLIREVTAQYMGCDDVGAPAYGTGEWTLDTDAFMTGLWQASCVKTYRSCGPSNPPTSEQALPVGNLYAPNIIESWTHTVQGDAAYPRSAQIYFNVSTGNPYQVILATARLQLPKAGPVYYKRWVHLRAYDGKLMVNSANKARISIQPGAAATHFQVLLKSNQNSVANLHHLNRVLIKADNGRYLTRTGAHDLVFVTTPTAGSEWIVERVAGAGAVNLDTDAIRLLSANTQGTSTERRIKVRPDAFYAYGGAGQTADLRLTWGCRYGEGDDC